MQIREILWASDGSKESRVALRWGELLAKRLGSKIIAFTVLETPNAAIPNEKQKGIIITENVKVFPRPWSGIVDFARKRKVDIIVMSTHGRRGVPRFFLGSAAESVIKNAPCPVIAVKP